MVHALAFDADRGRQALSVLVAAGLAVSDGFAGLRTLMAAAHGRVLPEDRRINRAGRFRSLGDGQVDFSGIFSKFAQYGFKGWAVLEWECCIKDAEQGAREGAIFIRDHIIKVAERAFDDFAAGGADLAANRRMLGIR